ncbi:MAG: TetR/AcrR family transcriptional regulator [Verrucomicrobiota bacterium]|nr:TetR/AcrR family transcriptional regulator [Verrucomicrobiota bacterium]
MDDLAAELRISKKTLYSHFPSKHELLEAVLREKFRGIKAMLAAAPSARTNGFAAALQSLLGGLQSELAELAPSFLRDMRSAPDVFQRLERQRAVMIREHFTKLFRDGQRAGEVRSDVSLDLMVETLLAAIQAIMNPAKLQELDLPPTAAFGALIDLLLRGAFVRKRSKAR